MTLQVSIASLFVLCLGTLSGNVARGSHDKCFVLPTAVSSSHGCHQGSGIVPYGRHPIEFVQLPVTSALTDKACSIGKTRLVLGAALPMLWVQVDPCWQRLRKSANGTLKSHKAGHPLN